MVKSQEDNICDFDNSISFSDICKLTPEQARIKIRNGCYSAHTAGIAKGYLQGNLAILPKDYALDFFRYCQRNPKPCPLIGVSDTGDPFLPTLGANIDIRTDVPLYNVYRDGELKEQVTDIKSIWSDDLVTFVIGCSFSFEEAMVAEGLSLRHIDQNKTVSMYKTNIDTIPAGVFSGKMVVSMRPFKMVDAIRATEITSRFPQTHGSPIHIGNPSEIGIENINQPDWGEPTEFNEGEVPVFWACGVTPQAAIRNARPRLCITHAPGAMLVSDIPSWAA